MSKSTQNSVKNECFKENVGMIQTSEKYTTCTMVHFLLRYQKTSQQIETIQIAYQLYII